MIICTKNCKLPTCPKYLQHIWGCRAQKYMFCKLVCVFPLTRIHSFTCKVNNLVQVPLSCERRCMICTDLFLLTNFLGLLGKILSPSSGKNSTAFDFCAFDRQITRLLLTITSHIDFFWRMLQSNQLSGTLPRNIHDLGLNQLYVNVTCSSFCFTHEHIGPQSYVLFTCLRQ